MVKKHFNRLKDLKQKQVLQGEKSEEDLLMTIKEQVKLMTRIKNTKYYLQNNQLKNLITKHYKDVVEVLEKYNKERNEMIEMLKSNGFNVNIVETIQDLKQNTKTDIYILFVFDMNEREMFLHFLLYYKSNDITETNIQSLHYLMNSFIFSQENDGECLSCINTNKTKLLKMFRNDEDLMKCCICFENTSTEKHLIKNICVCDCSSTYCLECSKKIKFCCICKKDLF